MIPLFTQAEFDATKSRQLLPLQCKNCQKPFYKTKHHIQDANKNTKEKYDYCTIQCCNLSLHPQKISFITCEQCGKPFQKSPAAIKSTKHHFCSKSCSAKYHNAHKKGGCRCSKMEKWLQEQLPAIYPGLSFHFNKTDAINAELDIYIPSLKLAFELNGIFHYEPIFGPEKLATIQTNDARKYQACLENGIELCILDVSTMTYFKPSKAIKYLDIIRKVIDAKPSVQEGDVIQPLLF